MSTNISYPGLPKPPPSANLPQKPDLQSTPLHNTEGQSTNPSDAGKNPLTNAQGHKPAQRPDTPKNFPDIPGLSSTTKDILARVQNGRSTPAGERPQVGYVWDANPLTGSFQTSVSSGHGQSKCIISNSFPSGNAATGANLSTQNKPSSDTGRGYTDGRATYTDSYRGFSDHLNELSTSTSFTPASQNLHNSKPDSLETTIQVASNVDPPGSVMPAPSSVKPTAPSSSRRERQYVLPDGTITSGKGLGRGRPGIKRGPRKRKLDKTPSESSTTNIAAASPVSGTKRKLSLVNEEDEHTNTRVSVSDDTDSDDYTPKATHTRSGRHTQKPLSFVPTDAPATKKHRLTAETSTSHIKSTLLIKKKIYKGKEQNALCEICSRGRSTVDNAIVFCDGCNYCWHQECHDPKISKEVVKDTTAQWFCKTCSVILNQIAKDPDVAGQQNVESKVDVANFPAKTAPPRAGLSVPPRNIAGEAAVTIASTRRVGARSLNVEQRQQYLGALSRQQLLDLVLHASEIAPDLPIFPAPAPEPTVSVSSNPAPKTALAPTPTTIPGPPPAAGPSANPSSTAANTMRPPPPPPPPLATSPNPNLNPSRAAKAAAPKYTSPSSPSSDSDDSSDEEEQEQDYDEDDYGPSHSKCYPKPGQGLMSRLPPDKSDEHILLEESECRTFSHSVKGKGTGVFAFDKSAPRGLGDENKENWIRGA
jgi:hypothetical protein